MPQKIKGLIRPHADKLISLYRLLDTAIIVATLWLIFRLYQVQIEVDQSIWILIAIVCFNFLGEIGNIYSPQRGKSRRTDILVLAYVWFCVVAVLLIIAQITPLVRPQFQELFWLWLSIVPIELISWHLVVKTLANRLRSYGYNSRVAAVIGVTELGKEIENIITQQDWLGMVFHGYYDGRNPEQSEARIKIDPEKFLGDYSVLLEDAKKGVIDVVYIALPMMAERRIKTIVDTLADSTLSVYFVPDLFMFDLLRSQWYSLHGLPVVSIFDTPFYGIDGFAKRCFDVIVASLILLLIAVPMLLIAIAIKLDSKGPILFKQRRYGFKGEEVMVWKFRSMKVAQDGAVVPQAQKNDPRITKLGRILRSTSLDELPQFINVLQGRMSVVGPRPHAVSHNEFYRGQIKGYMLRHKVKPGITGWAQINGYRGETDTLDKMEARVKYDLEYIRNWSIILDVKIILLTVFKGFLGANAY